MLTFKTQFPIAATKTTDDFLECVRIWIAGSPHHELANQLSAVRLSDGASFVSTNESLTCSTFRGDDKEIAGVRFEKREDEAITWVTDVVASRSPDSFMVAVQLSVDSDLPVERIDQGKAPYVLKSIMRHLGGGLDGTLQVGDTPLHLKDNDVSLVADILCAKTQSAMPVVYVSVDKDNKPVIDVDQLAKWLPGMAHVIVEPSRSFSFKLMRQVYGENVYGGAVGIYWPDGVGKWTFLPEGRLSTPIEMQLAVVRKVRASLLSQRTKRECTWSNLQDLVARKRLQELKDSGSSNVDEYIEQFDAEMASKEEEIRKLEAELARARYGRQFEVEQSEGCDGIELNSIERDLYQGERLDMVMDALKSAAEGAPQYSRRRAVLTEIIERNSRSGEREEILERLKPVLHQYSSLTGSVRAELEAVGFEIHEEGKHYKLLYRGDSRYPFVMSRTSSDWRGGKNAFSELRRLLF